MQGMNMPKLYSPMATFCQTQLEASRQFADALFSSAEKLDQVLLAASHRACIEQLRFAQSLASVRDPQGAADVQAKFFSQRPDRAMNYQRELVRVFTEVQAELGNSMRTYMEQIGSIGNGAASEFASEAERDAPTAADIYSPMTGIFSVWQSAFREAASAANRNMEVARSTFENVVNTVQDNAGEVVDTVDETAEAMTAGREKKSGNQGNHGSKRNHK
ncbi:phasin family protein [Paucimonas lemoignei]|uniref:Phasin family protein n=1 Tax=Paucimonas lemoignei TaxID=29443 RepID=A0A4R3HRK3_PAULE|nr:phasin family protein [Paucimonas lemoignei]TCS35747.1 phasin family protein [Paucimonas lemoignei]